MPVPNKAENQMTKGPCRNLQSFKKNGEKKKKKTTLHVLVFKNTFQTFKLALYIFTHAL